MIGKEVEGAFSEKQIGATGDHAARAGGWQEDGVPGYHRHAAREFTMRQPRIVSPLLIGGLLGSFLLGLSFPEVLAGAQRQQLAQGGLPEAYAPIHESGS